jgi:hypothetical protein
MWADIDTKKDFLNYAEAAAVVSDVIEDTRMLPTSIGVFGTWGTGKSRWRRAVCGNSWWRNLRVSSTTRLGVVAPMEITPWTRIAQ